MQVPEEVRQSLNPLSHFQVLIELLCHSSAWSPLSEISSCQSLCLPVFASLWHASISPAPLPPHFSYICQRSFLFPSIHSGAAEPSLLYLQWPGCPANCLGVENWGLLTGGKPHWTTMRLPNSHPASSQSQWQNASEVLWKENPTVSEGLGSKRYDFQDPRCSLWGTRCPCWLLSSMGCWLYSVTFWVRYVP